MTAVDPSLPLGMTIGHRGLVVRLPGSRLAPDHHEMRTPAEHGRFRLECARHAQKDLTSRRVLPAFSDIGKNPARPFDAVQPLDIESGADHLGAQLLGPMEVRGGEVAESIGRVLVMPIAQVLLDDALELAIVQQLARETVERRGPARNPGSDQGAAGSQHASGFGECRMAIGRVHQVVERTEHQHDGCRVVRLRQCARVGDGARR